MTTMPERTAVAVKVVIGVLRPHSASSDRWNRSYFRSWLLTCATES